MQMVDYSKQTERIIEQDPSSPRQSHHTDSDTDFQARAVESEADETADEEIGAVNVEELRSPEKRPSLGIAASKRSPENTQSKNNAPHTLLEFLPI